MWKARRERREIEELLRTFMVEELIEEPYGGKDPLADDAIDSLGQEQLAEYINEVYGVELADEDMVEENFESLAALAALVESRLRAGAR